MTAFASLRIETLSGNHDRRAFSCGEPALDEYLRRYARQHAKTHISRTYVASEGRSIHGYYSLAMAAISKQNLPERQQKRFPRHPLPVARLARLAVDSRHQGQGLGELLLADALRHCLRLSDEIGMIGVIVDTKNDRAREWYQRYEFDSLPDTPLTLWLPMEALRQL